MANMPNKLSNQIQPFFWSMLNTKLNWLVYLSMSPKYTSLFDFLSPLISKSLRRKSWKIPIDPHLSPSMNKKHEQEWCQDSFAIFQHIRSSSSMLMCLLFGWYWLWGGSYWDYVPPSDQSRMIGGSGLRDQRCPQGVLTPPEDPLTWLQHSSFWPSIFGPQFGPHSSPASPPDSDTS